MKNLINLKTQYDFLNSIIKMDDYITFAKQNNMESVFLSDELFMYGASELYNLAIKNNLKPVIGFSLTFSDCHIIFYAKNKKGFQSASLISCFFQNQNNYTNNSITKYSKDILDLAKNLYIIFSPLTPEAYKSIDINKLTNEIDFVYGVNYKNKEFIKNFKDKYVWSNEICYFNRNDENIYKALQAIKNNVTFNSVVLASQMHYFEENQLKEIIDISIHEKFINDISKKCDFELFNKKENNFVKPSIDTKKFIEDQSQKKLDSLIKNGLINKEQINIYKQRIDHEISVISSLGFCDYFYVVSDFISFANKNNILVGPGRGSAAGSLISYLLEITTVDPIKYDLLFERFLNKDRVTKPDIDIDIQDNKREDVLRYLQKKYGEDKFATIVTFQNIGLKQALRDCERLFPNFRKYFEYIHDKSKASTFIEFDNDLKNIPEWDHIKKEEPIIIDIIKNIIGLPRQSGTHASGVVFSNKNLNQIIPIRKSGNEIVQTQVSMDYLESFGLIKIDILGLKNLTIINEILSQAKLSKDFLNKIPLDDKSTYDAFTNKQTDGIFQFESQGIKEVLSKIKPTSIYELADASALFRPGPQNYIDTYVKNKLNKSAAYINDDLKNILSQTYNVIVYQEQLMKILQVVANFTLNEADIIRRAISKKNINIMESYKDSFFKNAKKNGYNDKQINNIWMTIEEFADYGFNKSHAICYALISYWLQYFKINYPSVFYSCQLNNLSSGDEKFKKYIFEAQQRKINFIPCSLEDLKLEFTSVESKIQIPITAIKGITKNNVGDIATTNFKNKNILEAIKIFVDNKFTAKQLKSLFACGLFDKYKFSRKQLIFLVDKLIVLANVSSSIKVLHIEQMVDKPSDITMYEELYMGISFTNNFYIKFREANKSLKTIREIINIPGRTAKIICKIIRMNVIKTKKNDEMAFLYVFDGTEYGDIAVFPDTFKETKDKLDREKYFVMNVNVRTNNNENGLVLNDSKINEVKLSRNE